MRMRRAVLALCATCAAAAAAAEAEAGDDSASAPQQHWGVVQHDGDAALGGSAAAAADEPCRFNIFACDAAAVAAHWRPCCGDAACPEACGDGELRAGSRVLLVGNSHMLELHQALLCMNQHHLTSITLTPFIGPYGNAYIMAGLPPPATVTWTYDAAKGELWDEKGSVVPRWHEVGGAMRNGRHNDAIVAYTFANGARLLSVTNTPLVLTARARDAARESPSSPAALAAHLGFDWSDLTAIVINEGNYRSWAHKLWCRAPYAAKAVEAAAAAAAGGSGAQHGGGAGAACAALLDRSRSSAGLIDIENFLIRAADAGFRGRAVAVQQFFRDTRGAPPPPLSAAARAALAARAPALDVRVFDWTRMMEGRLCATPACEPRNGDHQCLPGPPADVARALLVHVYDDG